MTNILTRIAQHQDDFVHAFEQAGKAILDIYGQTEIDIQIKQDQSPVTIADLKSNDIITKVVKKFFPDIPLISEEEAPEDISQSDYFFLLDPLDGTKEFIKKYKDFTINLGLIYKNSPIYGIISAPAYQQYFIGNLHTNTALIREGNESFAPMKTRLLPDKDRVMVCSRHHGNPKTLEAFKKEHHIKHLIAKGSSLKICEVAAGKADYYPRFGPTMEWDTAAAQAILEAAGGRFLTLDHKPFLYRKPRFKNPGFMVYGQ